MFRVLVSGKLAACALLFFLPWVEVQCPLLDLNKPGDPRTGAYTPLITQTGLQAAKAEYTVQDATMRGMQGMQKQAAGPLGKEDEIKPAPLLFGFPVAVGFGALLALVLPPGWAKKGLVLLCCALALGSVGGQLAMGFPIEKTIADAQNRKEPEGDDDGPRPFGRGGFKGADSKEEVFRVVYKWPLYAGLALAAAAALVALVEPIPRPKPAKRRDGDEPLEVTEWVDDPDGPAR